MAGVSLVFEIIIYIEILLFTFIILQVHRRVYVGFKFDIVSESILPQRAQRY